MSSNLRCSSLYVAVRSGGAISVGAWCGRWRTAMYRNQWCNRRSTVTPATIGMYVSVRSALSLPHGLSVQPASELAGAATRLDSTAGLAAPPKLAAATAGLGPLDLRRRHGVAILDNTPASSAPRHAGIGNSPRRSAAPQPTQRRPGGPNPAASSPGCSRPVPHPPDVGQDPGHTAAYRATYIALALAAHRRWPRARGHRDR